MKHPIIHVENTSYCCLLHDLLSDSRRSVDQSEAVFLTEIIHYGFCHRSAVTKITHYKLCQWYEISRLLG